MVLGNHLLIASMNQTLNYGSRFNLPHLKILQIFGPKNSHLKI
jgi:hypothetical protein